jgi:hypothetical protein
MDLRTCGRMVVWIYVCNSFPDCREVRHIAVTMLGTRTEGGREGGRVGGRVDEVESVYIKGVCQFITAFAFVAAVQLISIYSATVYKWLFALHLVKLVPVRRFPIYRSLLLRLFLHARRIRLVLRTETHMWYRIRIRHPRPALRVAHRHQVTHEFVTLCQRQTNQPSTMAPILHAHQRIYPCPWWIISIIAKAITFCGSVEPTRRLPA